MAWADWIGPAGLLIAAYQAGRVWATRPVRGLHISSNVNRQLLDGDDRVMVTASVRVIGSATIHEAALVVWQGSKSTALDGVGRLDAASPALEGEIKLSDTGEDVWVGVIWTDLRRWPFRPRQRAERSRRALSSKPVPPVRIASGLAGPDYERWKWRRLRSICRWRWVGEWVPSRSKAPWWRLRSHPEIPSG